MYATSRAASRVAGKRAQSLLPVLLTLGAILMTGCALSLIHICERPALTPASSEFHDPSIRPGAVWSSLQRMASWQESR